MGRPEIADLKELPDRVQRHLPFAQGAVAILTGLITITGAGYSVYRYWNPPPDKGQLEVVIQDAESGGSMNGATLEILSTSKALIAALAADQDGRVHYTLKDGRYEVRVRREGYSDVIREIQMTPGQDVALTVRMTSTVPPVKGLQKAVKKIIGR